MWDYLYFLVYLRHKEETEYSGVESYVAECQIKENLEWLPTKMSMCLEHDAEAQTSVPQLIEHANEELRQDLSGQIKELKEMVQELGQAVL